jgi:hypothetical protein
MIDLIRLFLIQGKIKIGPLIFYNLQFSMLLGKNQEIINYQLYGIQYHMVQGTPKNIEN